MSNHTVKTITNIPTNKIISTSIPISTISPLTFPPNSPEMMMMMMNINY